ncbi:hypothetical protein C8R41DRAFT_825961 [Lentinula lateritia]|uniref:Uncharacterized protein n=1 Tax=Lentinula lateritia TaxID=40482 RepID=A0ABQ8VJH5_9AGAR|nr:hypothetical protein C8R41DRAFT_825961 [Lentinula lateritia]
MVLTESRQSDQLMLRFNIGVNIVLNGTIHVPEDVAELIAALLLGLLSSVSTFRFISHQRLACRHDSTGLYMQSVNSETVLSACNSH